MTRGIGSIAQLGGNKRTGETDPCGARESHVVGQVSRLQSLVIQMSEQVDNLEKRLETVLCIPDEPENKPSNPCPPDAPLAPLAQELSDNNLLLEKTLSRMIRILVSLEI